MLAGPQFSNFMAAIAPAYGTEQFPQPPSNLLNGYTPVPAPNTRQNTQATPAPNNPAASSPAAPAPAPSSAAPAPSNPGSGNKP